MIQCESIGVEIWRQFDDATGFFFASSSSPFFMHSHTHLAFNGRFFEFVINKMLSLLNVNQNPVSFPFSAQTTTASFKCQHIRQDKDVHVLENPHSH